MSNELMSELEVAIRNGDNEKILSVCDRVIASTTGTKKQKPEDLVHKEILHCKLLAFIHLGKFDDALKWLDTLTDSTQFDFERSYCLYRLKNHEKAIELLLQYKQKNQQQRPRAILELEGQLYFRLEQWQKCISTYETLLKQFSSEIHSISELKTNLFAAYISAGSFSDAQRILGENKQLMKESHEFAYNAATSALQQNDFETALQYLRDAEKICKELLTEEGASDAEIADELAVIQTQRAFLLQIQGKDLEEAQRLYQEIIHSKPSDESVLAVAENNIVGINQTHDLFDSFKKLKHATSETMNQKLTSFQKKAIGFNRCLVLLHMNKPDQAKELLNLLQQQFPNDARLNVAAAALLYRDKKGSKQAEEVLQSFVSGQSGKQQSGSQQQKSATPLAQISLAQLRLSSSNVRGAISTLESIINEYQPPQSAATRYPAIFSTLIVLYEQINDIDSAIRTWDLYLSGIQENSPQYLPLLKKVAKFKLDHRRYKEALSAYEKILKISPDDQEGLPGVVIASAYVDSKLAEKYQSKLPSLQTDVNVEQLESLAFPSTSAKIASSTSTTPTPTSTPSKASPTPTQTTTTTTTITPKKTNAPATTTPTTKPTTPKGQVQPAAPKGKAQTNTKQTTTSTTTTTATPAAPVKAKKRRHKKRLPKNFDPNVQPDPERWLPMKERSAYKKKAKKNLTKSEKEKMDKQAQGAVEAEPTPSTTATKPKTEVKPPAALANKQVPARPQHGKKRK